MRKYYKTALILGVCALPFPSYAIVPDSGEIEFEILRDGKPFGSHIVRFEEQGDVTRVVVDIEMEYALGPITLFEYQHSNEELWRGNRVLSLASQTNDDGDDYAVNAKWGDVLQVEVNGERYEAPSSLYTTSYWNPVMLKASQLLNTQKGKVEDVAVLYKGQAEFTTAVDVLNADHYQVDASLPLNVWYDAQTKQWVGLKFEVRGSEIEYRRLTPIQ